jgi:hypothetical protein
MAASTLLVVLLGVLLLSAIQRMATQVHDQVLDPTFHRCLTRTGIVPKECAHTLDGLRPRERTLVLVLKFACTVLLVLVIWALLVPTGGASPPCPPGKGRTVAL